MDAIIRFLQDTGFYLFSQDGNWRCLIMLGIACVLLYLGIVKKFEPLLLVPIAFGMLITNLPGANMFHEIFFAGGHIHWDLIGGQPVTASLLADLHSQGVAENVLAPYIQQLMTAAQTTFSPEMVEQAIAAVTEEAGAAITPLEAQLQALVQAEQAAAYYGMTLSDITITPGLVDILYLGVKLGIYPCLIFMGVGAMTDFGPLIANPKSLLLGAAAQLGIFITFVGCRFMGFTGPESSAIGIIGGYLTGVLMLHINEGAYLYRIASSVTMNDVAGGFIKSLVFGLLVATVCCHQGYTTHMRRDSVGPEAVGNATTSAVVISCVLILVADYVLTSFLL